MPMQEGEMRGTNSSGSRRQAAGTLSALAKLIHWLPLLRERELAFAWSCRPFRI